jgi:hypothetical protein
MQRFAHGARAIGQQDARLVEGAAGMIAEMKIIASHGIVRLRFPCLGRISPQRYPYGRSCPPWAPLRAHS